MKYGRYKSKKIKDKSIKGLDKTVAWTERVKDSIVYLNDRTKDYVEGNNTISEYGEDKIKYYSNRTKNETIFQSKKVANKTTNKLKKEFQKRKMSKNTSKNVDKTIKNTNKGIKKLKML